MTMIQKLFLTDMTQGESSILKIMNNFWQKKKLFLDKNEMIFRLNKWRSQISQCK